MQALAKETFTPEFQESPDEPVSYQIAPLKSMELTEVLADGCKHDPLRLTFHGIKLCLKYGAPGTLDLNKIPSSHHAELAQAIFGKALLAEQERKNSSSQLR